MILTRLMAALFVLLLANSIRSEAGTEIRGGGDAILCEPRPNLNSFSGTYSLDYILGATSYSLEAYQLAEIESLEQSIERIVSTLTPKVPLLAKSLSEYYSLIRNYHDFTKPRIWLAVSKLADLKDEDLIYEGPENCIVPSTGAANLKQVVSRVYDPDTGLIRYYFDRQIYSQILSNGPLQVSFLHIHEWLWDFIAKDRINSSRIINWILHSKTIESMPGDELRIALKNLGVPDSLLSQQGEPTSPPLGDDQGQRLVVNERYNCAIKDSSLICWGDAIPKGLGPLNAMAEKPLEIAGGRQHLCVRTATKVECFGDQFGFLGIEKIKDARKIVASFQSTCAVRTNRQVVCFGQISRLLTRTLTMKQEQKEIAISNRQICLSNDEVAECHLAPNGLAQYRPDPGEKISGLALNNVNLCVGYTSSIKCYRNGTNQPELMSNDWTNPKQLAMSPTKELLVCAIDNGMVNCLSSLPANAVASLPEDLEANSVLVGDDHACAMKDDVVLCWGENAHLQNSVPPQLQ